MNYHYTYLIKNKLSKKKYIGVRSCKYNPANDNYWGSSELLSKDINKLGIKHFKKRILKIWNTRQEAGEHESQLLKKYGKLPVFYNKTHNNYVSKLKQLEQPKREICKCGNRPVAINYCKDNITHYRSTCSVCAKKPKAEMPKWKKAGYVKKKHCEKCNFKAKYETQLDVYTSTAFKTVCLNCKEELEHTGTWIQGDLVADF
jgi:hypothetical protein